MPLLGQERPQREGDRKDQGEEVAERDDVGRGGAIGAVLLRPVVAQRDLVLVVEPALVVLGPGGVEDPLAEPLPHRAQVVPEGLAVGSRGEGGQQVRMEPDEAVPDVEDRLDLVLQDAERRPQRPDVVLAEEDALLQLLELGQRHRRARHLLRSVGVSGDAHRSPPFPSA